MAATVSAATVSAASAMALQRIPPAKEIAREKKKAGYLVFHRCQRSSAMERK